MPDDAIERARLVLADVVGESAAWTAKNIRNNTDAGGALPVATADALRAMLAFASQQAPDGWVLDWLAKQPALELFYFTDDQEDVEWRVARISGPVNDREWTEVGRGETPLAALLDAYAAMLDAAPSVTLGEVG